MERLKQRLRKEVGIKDVVVVAREDQAGQKRLAAYAAVDLEKGVTAEALRASLRKTLPEYMVPPTFVLLEALPLTPNGKVDRKALPAPAQTVAEKPQEFIEPRTTTEREVTSAWAEVLQIKYIGMNQNFFEMGGDSLQAARVVSRVQERLNVKLALSSLFETPTIESLSGAIDSGRGRGAGRDELPLTAVPREKPCPCRSCRKDYGFSINCCPGTRHIICPGPGG